MSDHKLVLVAEDAAAEPPKTAEPLVQALRAAGLIGDSFDCFGDLHYTQGPRFFELVKFERTHPVIELVPGATGLVETGPFDSGSACTIEIGEPRSEISCFTSCDVVPPNCPACNHRFEDWSDILSTWFSDQASFLGWNCPGCGKDYMPWELDWHRRWGFGRFSIDIWNVSLGEAAPSDELLALLSATTHQSWSYFYTHL
jgi:hypothetical protein